MSRYAILQGAPQSKGRASQQARQHCNKWKKPNQRFSEITIKYA